MAAFGTFFHGKMSGLEITCIQSFLDHGHDVEIFTYRDCGAPSHFKITDARKVLEKKHLFRYRSGPGKGSVSAFTNRFRYALMATTPDMWWIDTDVICLRRDWPQPEAPICAAWEDEIRVGTAVLQLDQSFAAKLNENASSLGKKVEWGQTGPDLITSIVRSENMGAGILPAPTFYPLHYNEWMRARVPEFRDELRVAAESSYAVHLWNEMARRSKLNKWRLPHRDSFLGSIVQSHGTAKYFRADRQAAADGALRWRNVFSYFRS